MMKYTRPWRNKECMTMLIESGADVNRHCHGLSLPLIHGAEAGTDANKENRSTYTPRTPSASAVQYNHQNCLKLLIEAEADVN